MSSVDAIIDINVCSEWIDLQTQSSKDHLHQQLQTWSYDLKKLEQLSAKFKRFKAAFDKDPTFFGKCHELFKEISEIEERLNQLIGNESELEKESYNEILFFKPMLQPLNFVPFLLTIWSAIRIYILPGISLLFPLFILIAPYIILKFVFCIPMTLNNYVNILHSMLTGNVQGVMDPTKIQGQSLPFIKLMKQFGLAMVTIVQSIVQPYWSYKHLKSIDAIIQENGKLILRFKEIYDTLETLLTDHGFTFFKCPLPPLPNERDAVARVILDSNYFKLALKYIGSLEVLMSLAHQKDVHPVRWLTSDTPVFHAKETFDFQVPEVLRKTINVSFHTKRHALLTGPNKGGKSTVLRALSVSALLAHTYGCGCGFITMTPFQKMFVCLKPDDLPGSKSRFEREIEFTAHTLMHKEPILVLIDELYHSTNPPDALRSCQIYCKQLWEKQNVISVISTHLFELVEKADPNIQRICCPANVDKHGRVEFLYHLIRGVCKVSSVDTLLEKNGLMRPACARF